MKKYLQIIKGTIAEYMEYRLNFILWRVRWVVQRLVIYFLWLALLGGRQEIFGYTLSAMLTYVLLTNVVGTVVLSTRTMDVANIINTGALSNNLLRPFHFFHAVVAREVADKAINIAFSILEVLLLIMLLRPPLFLQTDIVTYITFTASVLLGAVLYFFFSLSLSFFGFWTPDVWSVRFLSFVVMEFFAGGLFPLDILPAPLFALSRSLPFFYFIYFPIKVYIGELAPAAIISGFLIGFAWMIAFWYIASSLWRRGLRVYAAEGK